MLRTIYPLLVLFLFAVNANAQSVLVVKQADGTTKEVLLLPANTKIDSSWQEIGSIKNKKGISKRFDEFNIQAEKLAEAAISKGGNIILLDKIRDRKQMGLYNIRSTVYNTSDYDHVKARMLQQKAKQFEPACAYLIIYRPVYTFGHNDEIGFKVNINDTLDLDLQANYKYVIKLTHEGTMRLLAAGKESGKPVVYDVKFGNTYYVRGFVSYPFSGKRMKKKQNVDFNGYNPYIQATGELQGELESSTVTQIILKKTL